MDLGPARFSRCASSGMSPETLRRTKLWFEKHIQSPDRQPILILTFRTLGMSAAYRSEHQARRFRNPNRWCWLPGTGSLCPAEHRFGKRRSQAYRQPNQKRLDNWNQMNTSPASNRPRLHGGTETRPSSAPARGRSVAGLDPYSGCHHLAGNLPASLDRDDGGWSPNGKLAPDSPRPIPHANGGSYRRLRRCPQTLGCSHVGNPASRRAQISGAG